MGVVYAICVKVYANYVHDDSAFDLQVVFNEYPRIQTGKEQGMLDTSKIVSHTRVLTDTELKSIIRRAIRHASQKSSARILDVPENASDDDIKKHYLHKGKDLFDYFRDYVIDPASSAKRYVGKSYKSVAVELFITRTAQMERMNAGWRYQFIAVHAASKTGRFEGTSDIGSKDADFLAKVATNDEDTVNIFVSVKNRADTIGGPDWAPAIDALENHASADKNKIGPYLCVFGIAMDGGMRSVKKLVSL